MRQLLAMAMPDVSCWGLCRRPARRALMGSVDDVGWRRGITLAGEMLGATSAECMPWMIASAQAASTAGQNSVEDVDHLSTPAILHRTCSVTASARAASHPRTADYIR
jgi:hypothetical protein